MHCAMEGYLWKPSTNTTQCGHCKNLAPLYSKVATSFKGLVRVAAIDCDDEKNKPTCGQHGIQGFPTIKIMTPKKSAKKGNRLYSVEDYNGERTVKGIADHITSVMRSKVQRISSEDQFTTFLETKNDTAKVILLTKKGSISPIYKGLSTKFGERVLFAQIRDTQAYALEALGVNTFPTVMALPGGTQEAKIHTGGIKIDELVNFVKQVVPADTKDDSEDETSDEADVPVMRKPAKPGFETLADVNDFSSKCLGSTAKPAILANKGLLADIGFKSKLTDFNYFEYDPSIESQLETLGIKSNGFMFLNGKKKWYISPEVVPGNLREVLDFIDNVKQGTAGAKTRFTVDEPKDEL